jgi:hypothetical protein
MSSMNRSSGGAGTRPTYSIDSVWPTRVQFAIEVAGPAIDRLFFRTRYRMRGVFNADNL